MTQLDARSAGLAAAMCLVVLAAACGTEPQPSATAGPPTGAATVAPASPVATATAGTGASGSPAVTPAGSAPADTQPPDPTATPVSTPELDLSAGIRWSRASAASEFQPGDTISAAIRLDSTLVAVGASETDGGAIWTSRDGLAWRRVPDLAEAAQATVDSITLGPAGLVAVGSTTTDIGLAPAVWLSGDGLAWEAIHDPDLGAGEMAAVAAGPDGYVALGTDIESGDANVLWTSTDGRDWSGPATAEAFGAQPSVSDVIRLPSMFLAVGARDDQAAIWQSNDGRAWETAPDFPIVPGGVVTGATVAGSRVLAVGANYGGSSPAPFAWWSADGASWQSAAIAAGIVGGEMLGVLSVGEGGVAVGGEEGTGGRGGLAAVWISLDGLTWQRQPDDPGFGLARMSIILHAGSGLVVLGEAATDVSGEEFAPAVWIGIPGSPATESRP